MTALNQKPDFNNTETAFADVSNKDLKRSHLLFWLMNHSFLVRLGTVFMLAAVRLHLPILGILKRTIFRQFIGGENLKDTTAIVKRMSEKGIFIALDFAKEREHTEEIFENTTRGIIESIEYAKKNPQIIFSTVKVTSIGNTHLMEHLQAKASLSESEKKSFEKIKDRLGRICKSAYENQIPILVDAEETWIQRPIDEMAIEMMKKYNHGKAVVFNTYQMYLRDKLNQLKHDYENAVKENYIFAVKLVRGAYLEKEHLHALTHHHRSPIHHSKSETDRAYNEALEFITKNINGIALCAGTHNEESTNHLIALIEKYQIPRNHPNLFFAQLYGTSDNLTYNLAQAKYNTAKYVPYGPLKSVLPYLIRRAHENSSIAGQSGRQMELIRKEMKRRNLL